MANPPYLKAFKDFAKSRPTAKDLEEIQREFYGDSDRSCGILHASWTELAIESAIKAILGPNGSIGLFEYEGPLGSFAAKIKVGKALGLYGTKTHHDLQLIRTVRNEFAHCQLPLRFEIDVIRKVCDHLLIPDTPARVMPSYFYSLPDEKPQHWCDESHPKTRFVICCYSIIYNLLQMARGHVPQPLCVTSLP